jgi:small subunit ribosomal protein S20
MAHHKSAQKRIRRNETRSVVNGNRMSRIRTFIKRVVLAVESGDAKAADEALKKAQPEIYRGVSKGLIKKNAAARKMSRLSASIKRIKTAA